MSGLRTTTFSSVRIAKELARLALRLGGGEAASLAAFGRFVEPEPSRLRALVDLLPHEGRKIWRTAMQLLEPRAPQPIADALIELSAQACSVQWRDRLAADRKPVTPEGLLWELLLRELDSSSRRRLGMFFTPQPLVGFLVCSALRMAQRLEVNREIHVIDPACGYGGFLSQATAKPVFGRISGIELCRATWAVAHLLAARSCCPKPTTLLNINPLLAGESLRQFILGTPAQPLLPVIVGNPPWSNFGRQNRGPWIDDLLADYRAGLSERKSNLADDAIKFIRWSQYWVAQAGAGIVALVTPNTWLAGLTQRRMRESLLHTFDEMFVLDLHGEAGDKREDENVFGVRSGVAAVLMIKRRSTNDGQRIAEARVVHAAFAGSRQAKLHVLESLDTSDSLWSELTPHSPDWSFAHDTSRHAGNFSRRAPRIYASFWPINRIFRHYSSGVQTKNDAVFVGFTRGELAEQVRRWLDQRADPTPYDPEHVRPYFVAPFDRRWIYYDPALLGRARWNVMRHMLQRNLGFVFMRQSTNRGDYDHFLAVDCLVSDRVFYSRHGAPFLAPLWLDARGSWVGALSSEVAACDSYSRESVLSTEYSVPVANFTPEFAAAFSCAIGDDELEPRQALEYLYAVVFCPTYRRHYHDELCSGFPRIPLPPDSKTYHALHPLGHRLVELHMGQRCLATGAQKAEENDAEFRLGGYDVLRRWASPRAKRGLTPADKAELDRLAWIGCETRRLMAEIDEAAGDY